MPTLESFWDQKKKEIVTAISILGAIATLYTAIIFVDDRYVQAADFAIQIQQQQKILEDYRVQNLQDKIFELEFKEQSGVDTPLDRALKERYLQQLQTLHGR